MRAHAAFAALLLGAMTVAPASPAFAEPAGWVPLFATDFSGDALPSGCEAYDGPHAGVAASYYRPDEVAVSGGMLRLSMHRRDFGQRPYTTGGVGCYGLTQRYGRYEVRAKAPSGAGIDAFITLWPDGGTGAEAAVLHLLAKPGAETMVLSNSTGDATTTRTVDAKVAAFHTYLIEWTPAGFRVSIDDHLTFTDGRTSIARRWLGFAVSSGDSLAGLPDAATLLPATVEVDFIRVWAYDPDAGSPDGAEVPGGGRAGGGAAPTRVTPSVAAPVQAASVRIIRLAGLSARWLIVGLMLVFSAGLGAFGLRRRRPRRPPPAHRR